jgi:hypothetical protein
MLKHKFFTVCVGSLIFSSNVFFAQSIGIKIGPVYNHFISDQQHVKSNLGVVAGLSYTHTFSEKISLLTGLEYLQLGGGLLTIEDDTRYGVDPEQTPFAIKVRDCKVTIHSVNLPVIVNYSLVANEGNGIKLGIGPEVSYNFSAKSKETVTGPIGGGMWATYSQTNDETNNYETFNFAASANLGFYFDLGENQMSIDCRYRYGFTPIRLGYSYLDLPESKSDVYQGSLILSFTYSFKMTNNQNQ